MNTTASYRVPICRNAMEFLVIQEMKQQLQNVPVRAASYINQNDVMTYAMNRLPALYASTEQGWQYQILRGKKELSKQITLVVRQALTRVQCTPSRTEIPLKPQSDLESQVALQKLKELLRNEQLSWSNLVPVVEQTLVKALKGEITWKSKERTACFNYGWDDDVYSR